VPLSTVGGWLRKAAAEQEVIAASQAKAEVVQSAEAPAEPSKEASKVEAPAKKRRVAKHYTPSQREEILEHADRGSVTVTSKKFNVSRFSIYDWRNKVKRAAAGEGESPSPPT